MIQAYKDVRARAAAYRRLFLTASGALTPDAEIFFADLMRQAKFMQPVSQSILPEVEGGRQMVRFILGRIKQSEKVLMNTLKQELEDQG